MGTSLSCLAAVVFLECSICSLIEKAAVAYTVINRVNDKIGEFKYENSICEVANHEKWYANGDFNANGKSWKDSVSIARSILIGTLGDPTRGATHFHLDDGIERYWSEGMIKISSKDWKHIFWRPKR